MDPGVHRCQSSSASVKTYDAYSDDTPTEMMALNAIADPMLIRPITQLTSAITMIAYNGIAESSWTVAIVRQKGKPLSRPKAKTIREDVARKAIAAQMSMMITMLIMAEAPGRVSVAV